MPNVDIDPRRRPCSLVNPYGTHTEAFCGTQVFEAIFDHHAIGRPQLVIPEQSQKTTGIRLGTVARALDTEYIMEDIANAKDIKNGHGIVNWRIGKYDLPSWQPPECPAQFPSGDNHFLKLREIMRLQQKMLWINVVVPHQPNECRTIAFPIIEANAVCGGPLEPEMRLHIISH